MHVILEMSLEPVRENTSDQQAAETTLKQCFDIFFAFSFNFFAYEMKYLVEYNIATCNVILSRKG